MQGIFLLVITIFALDAKNANNIGTLFSFPIILLRSYMSPRDKLKHSKLVPNSFDQIMCGLILGDGNLRLNGKEALISIQQIHPELVQGLWEICSQYKLVTTPVKSIQRKHWKLVYYFQTLTMPYFTNIYNIWYFKESDGNIKKLPANINELLTPLAFAYWIIGDGGFDGSGRGLGRLSLHTQNFTLDEVKILQNILFNKYNIQSSVYKGGHNDQNRGWIIRIPGKSLSIVRSLCTEHMYSSIKYKLGL